MGGSVRGERWLGLVGVGEDGIDGLTPAARRLVAQADFVVGGKRHLALAGPLKAETFAWPSPIENALDIIEARRGGSVCVLASGDPFFFGVGAMLMRRFAADEMISIPTPSAFSLAASRLGWSQQDCALLTLHGRPLEAIIPHLQPGARILALSWDDSTPAKVAALLSAQGMGRSALTICEAMGGLRERIRTTEAQSFALDDVAALNTIALEVEADREARILPRAPGLPDDWFEHDGQITKREIRAVTLSQLAPRRGELLWDVGAGSGSIAIEWMLADPANAAVAIEIRPDRAERIARNALSFGVPGLSVVHRRGTACFRGFGRAGRDLHWRRGGRAGHDRARSRCAGRRRAARRQRGHAGDAGCFSRLAGALGRRACADRSRACRTGRALFRLARGDADRAVAPRQAMSRVVAIGIGCRAGVAGEAIAALARRALKEMGAPEGERRVFTLAAKAEEPGLIEAARLFGAKLTPLPLAALTAQAARILTPSPSAVSRFGAPNIAEAAALAGAGEGGRLLGPRLAGDGATCAIAVSRERP